MRSFATFWLLVARSIRALRLSKNLRGHRLARLSEVRRLLVCLESGLAVEGAKLWQSHPGEPVELSTWTAVVRELSQDGAPLIPTLVAYEAFLEGQIDADMDQYFEALPRRAQMILTACFAPGAFFILLFPWMRATF